MAPVTVYGGVEYTTPQLGGKLPPVHFKVHALEIHQLINWGLDDAEQPDFIKNRVNPHVDAVEGVVPLPWDPQHTGMPAVTFPNLDITLAPLLANTFSPAAFQVV